MIKYDAEFLKKQTVEQGEAIEKWKSTASGFFSQVSDCNGKPVVLEEFGFRRELGEERAVLYDFILEEAKKKSIHPIFSFWGQDTWNESLHVFVDDGEILKEIADFY